MQFTKADFENMPSADPEAYAARANELAAQWWRQDRVDQLRAAMRRAIELIEEQGDRRLENERPDWKKGAVAAVEELYGALSQDEVDVDMRECRLADAGLTTPAKPDPSFVQGYAMAALFLSIAHDLPSTARDLLVVAGLSEQHLLEAGVEEPDIQLLFPKRR
jgi:hypothetical protein